MPVTVKQELHEKLKHKLGAYFYKLLFWCQFKSFFIQGNGIITCDVPKLIFIIGSCAIDDPGYVFCFCVIGNLLCTVSFTYLRYQVGIGFMHPSLHRPPGEMYYAKVSTTPLTGLIVKVKYVA